MNLILVVIYLLLYYYLYNFYIFQLFGQDFNIVSDALKDDKRVDDNYSNYASIMPDSEVKNQNNSNLVDDYQV